MVSFSQLCHPPMRRGGTVLTNSMKFLVVVGDICYSYYHERQSVV